VEQDEDVLDTWFSSGLFPFSVFGWPDCSDDMEAFFPTSLLETGHDILFFWVARMVMMSIGLTGKLPFHTVYLHAMVRDARGRKMSKSSGNVIDPLEVIDGIGLEDLHKKLYEGNLPEHEIIKSKDDQKLMFPEGIPECGADALRFGLLAYTLQGRNVNLDVNRVVGYRHFCNKVWQGTKFGLRYFGEDFRFSGSLNLGQPLAWEDRWILSKLSSCAEKTNKGMENYEFANCTTATFNFFQYQFCDVYLELLKLRLHGEETAENAPDRKAAREVLYICLDWILRLLHPLLPYITEELYQRLPPSPNKYESICIASYPMHVIAWQNETLENEMEVVSEISKQFRSQKTSAGFAPKATPNGYVRHSDEYWSIRLQKLTSQLSRMGQIGEVKVLKVSDDRPSQTLQDVVNKDCLIFTEVAGLDLSKELEKLQKKVESAEKTVKSYEAKMSIPDYENKVPEPVRETNTAKLKEAEVEVEELKRAVDGIKEAMGCASKPAAKAASAKKAEPKAEAPKKAEKGGQKKKGQEDKGGASAAAAGAPAELSGEDRKKKLKKVMKEGGKRGVEIEGAADMGGLQFFCTAVEEPEGDLELLEECMKAMNVKSDPTEEERKGGSGHIGKMIFSAAIEHLAVAAYVPDEKQSECSCEEWLKVVLANFQGEVVSVSSSVCIGKVAANADKQIFPLKIREPMILEANNFLRKKGLFPEDNGDSDEIVFGDDDFPS
jgi:isoleucyl-tRNA synthetase